ncbi:beta-lactamase family protein [Akkermansiaceae bacterium]|nr:beta-lactamase family protein [Akkermansiaceae bacterium]MDA7630148.1 beta-lactamase family protein [bacterium]MDB4573140.1 beta-lactamase family protein [bacterium]
MKLVIYALILLAGTVNAGKTAKVIMEARNAANIPAVAAVSFDNQQIIAFEIAGTTRTNGSIAVKRNSVWHIGSDAKAMTATLIAILIEKKLLKWETTMSEIFPKLVDDFHPNARKTTITQLLSHTAGLPANPEGAQRMLSRREVTIRGLAQKPSEGFLYSNFGYIIAGAVIEKLLDMTWEKAIQQHLFKPLGIKSVGFGPPQRRNRHSWSLERQTDEPRQPADVWSRWRPSSFPLRLGSFLSGSNQGAPRKWQTSDSSQLPKTPHSNRTQLWSRLGSES